ncbi:MAG: hypothetical protein ACLQVJ_07935 [Syntrophobacteraceae bacterium]
MTEIFSESHPDVVENEYLVIGTVETKVWREGMIESLKMDEILEHTSDIKDHLVLHYEHRGWAPPDHEKPGTLRKAHKRPSPKVRS